jgi:glutathione S-transferase
VSELPVLWHIEISHYNEKARWALDYKGIPHVRKAPFPGTHGFYAAWLTRGRSRTFPLLQLNGRTIGDSTDIIAALEELQPEPPLYPEDPAERARALEIEDFFDVEVGPNVRRLVFANMLEDRELTIAGVEQSHPGRHRVMRATYPLARAAIRMDYGATEERKDEARRKVDEGLALIEAEAGPSGYLVGDAFSVADLAAAALIGPLTVPDSYPNAVLSVTSPVQELRDAVRARPAGQWGLEMYARHRGASVAVPA